MKVKIGTYRWRVVALLFFATTINYIDRQVIAILAPDLQKLFNWSEMDYSLLIMSFQGAYALGLLFVGRLLDHIGTKTGYSLAVVFWSLAAMFHGAARSLFTFVAVRFSLGIGESANFPAAIKAVAEWFPKRERALATGIFNAGTNVGAIITPIIVPAIAIKWGWQWAFISTGALGFIWLILWLLTYDQPEKSPRLTIKEKEYILQDEPDKDEKLKWTALLAHKQTLGICLARFVTDPVWWFFLYWVPKFLYTNYGIDLTNIGPPLILIYIVSIIGSVSGGGLSSFFISRGKNPVPARKNAILILSLFALPVYFVSHAQHMWISVLLISLAAFAHQGYAANIFTIVSDIYPKKAVGSVIGLSGSAGAVGGILFSFSVGYILEITGSYFLLFLFASVAYLLCWLFLKLFVPNSSRIDI